MRSFNMIGDQFRTKNFENRACLNIKISILKCTRHQSNGRLKPNVYTGFK